MDIAFNRRGRAAVLLAGIILTTAPMRATIAAPEEPVSTAPSQAAEMYARGVTWEQFLASAKVQRETWTRNAAREVSPELVARLQRAGTGLRLLVVAVDWCPDSANSVPYIAKLASSAGVGLRVIDFKAGKAIMEAHRTPDGRASTPTVVLLRGDQDVAAWVERPASLQWWYLDHAGQLSEDELLERKRGWYEWNRGADAVGEIVALAERSAKKP
jgi:hypothetical protein